MRRLRVERRHARLIEGVEPMGRGRAKAKQTKVARQLKYSSGGTDLERLQAELAAERGELGESDDEGDEDDLDAYAADQDDEDDEADNRRCPGAVPVRRGRAPARRCRSACPTSCSSP